MCVCLSKMVSITYCVLFLFCFTSACVPYITSFSGLSIFIASSVFSSACLQCSGGDFLLSLFELNYQNSVHVVVNNVGPLTLYLCSTQRGLYKFPVQAS